MTKTLNSTVRKSASKPAAKPDATQKPTSAPNPNEPAVSDPTPIAIGTTDDVIAVGADDGTTMAATAAAQLTPASAAATIASAELTSAGPAPTPEPAAPAAAKPPSKAQQLAALVVREEGATLDQMVAAIGWLPHTTRAALTGLKKKGYVISSDKLDGVRTYRGIAPE